MRRILVPIPIHSNEVEIGAALASILKKKIKVRAVLVSTTISYEGLIGTILITIKIISNQYVNHFKKELETRIEKENAGDDRGFGERVGKERR